MSNLGSSKTIAKLLESRLAPSQRGSRKVFKKGELRRLRLHGEDYQLLKKIKGRAAKVILVQGRKVLSKIGHFQCRGEHLAR